MMRQPTHLPHLVDDLRQAYWAGWWNGLSIGAAIGAGLVVLLFK